MQTRTTCPPVAISEEALAQLFTHARTCAQFDPTPIPRARLEQLYALASLGPTSMNCQPARFVFVASDAARERLLPHVAPGNRAKVSSAPVTVIVAARALGLACGPMSGFAAQGVNDSFFSDGRWEVDFLLNLGVAAEAPARPRGPRLDFSHACAVA